MATQAQQQAFIQAATPLALAVSQQTGLDPRVVIAQAALESNWGTAAPQNNYFGIKGSGASLPTSEFINGKEVPVNANFAAYPDMAGSFQGYGNLMSTNYYAPVRNAQGMDAQIAALGRSGYATEPDYASQVSAIAHSLPDISGGTGPQFANANDIPPLPTLPPQSPFNLGPSQSPFFGGAPFAPQLAGFTFTAPNLTTSPSPQPAPPTTPADVAATGGADTLTDPFLKYATVNYLGSGGANGFTPAEGNAIPPGPYGADALVRAALSGDPTAIQSAENSIMSAALQQEGLFGIDKAQANIQNYVNTLTQQNPGTVRQLQTVLNNNPSLQSLIPPQLQPLVQQAFNSLPPSPTAQIPLPNLAPPYTGSTSAPLVAGNSTAPQPQLASFNTSQPWVPPAPPQSFIPETDYTAAQSGFVPESDYALAQSGSLLPQAGTPMPMSAATVPDFSQFNNPLPAIGSSSPADWGATPYGASPDYGSVASTIGNAITGGLSSLFGGQADASPATSGYGAPFVGPLPGTGGSGNFIPETDYPIPASSTGSSNPLFDSGSLYSTPTPLTGGTPASPDTTAALNAPPIGIAPTPNTASIYAPPSTYNVQQSFSPATQAMLGNMGQVRYSQPSMPSFNFGAAGLGIGNALNLSRLPTSFPGFATVATAPKPQTPPVMTSWFPRTQTAGAQMPLAAAPALGLGGLAFPTLSGASPNAYSGSTGSSNYTFDPLSGKGIYTYVDPNTGQAGGTFDYSVGDPYGSSSGNDYSISGGNGF